MGSIPSYHDEVSVGKADMARLRDRKHVYLIGVNAGSFPKAVSDTSYFTDRDKLTLSKLGLAVTPDLDIKNARELYSFSRSFSLAERTVTLIYSTKTASLGAALPSEVISRIVEITDKHVKPQVIADLAGISMPEGTRVFVVELDKVGTDTPLSAEKLCPVLAFYTVENWVEACELCMELLEFGGLGHSLSIHSNNDEIIEQFGLLKPVSRILVNSPSSQGGIGYTTGLNPSLTLGCGTFGGNIASENITPLHLMNKKRIAYYNAPADFVLPTVSPVRQTGYSHEDIVAAVERALKNL
jgi:hypothetical protein